MPVKYFMSWAFALIIGLTTFAASPARAELTCANLFTPSKAAQRSLDYNARQETRRALVDDWLSRTDIAFTTGSNEISQAIYRFKEMLLLWRLNPYQLSNPSYRAWYVEKLTELKLGESLTPLEDFEATQDPREFRFRQKQMLQSMIDNGLRNWVADSGPGLAPQGRLARIIRAARVIRFHPAFRILTEWQLPSQTLQLSEAQIERLLDRGLGAFDTDPSLRKALRQATITRGTQALVKMAKAIIFTGATIMTYQQIYPKVEMAFEQAQAKANADATSKLQANVEAETQVPQADEAVLGLAQGQIDTIKQNFTAKHGPPGARAVELIKKHVCLDSLGEALSQAGQAKCMAL